MSDYNWYCLWMIQHLPQNTHFPETHLIPPSLSVTTTHLLPLNCSLSLTLEIFQIMLSMSFLHSKGLLNFFKFFIWNHQQHLRTEIKHKNIFQGKIYTKHGPWLNGNWQEYFCQIWWILDSVPHTHKYCHIWVYLNDQPSLFQKKCCYSLACLCTFLSGSA